MGKYIAAVDLGTTKVAVIVGEKTSTGLKIIGYKEVSSCGGITRGEIVNIQKILGAVKQAVEAVSNQINENSDINNIAINDVYVGIGGQEISVISDSLIKNRKNPSASIDEKEMEWLKNEVIAASDQTDCQIIHIEPQAYNVDNKMGIKDIIGVIGNELEIQYKEFLSNKNPITYTESVISKSGLRVKNKFLKHIAAAEAVLTDDEKELGCALLDIGGGTTNLIIYRENIIRHIAVIPFGGNIITDDIKQHCGLSSKNSELLKKRHGYCISEYAPANKHITIQDSRGKIIKNVEISKLSEAIEARVCEIIATAINEIDISGNTNKLRSGIIITGGSSELTHLQNLAQYLTKLNVRIGIPNSDRLNKKSIQDVFVPSASVAVGLLLKGAQMEEYTMDDENEGDTKKDMTIKTAPAGKVKKPKKHLENLWGDLFKSDNEA